MLDDPFAHLKCQIQSPESRISQLEIFHYAQCVKIVVKEQPVAAHCRIQRLLPGMAEWGMADVVNQSQRLYQVYVQIELCGHGTRNLRHFDGVSQSVAEVVGITSRKDLSLRF